MFAQRKWQLSTRFPNDSARLLVVSSLFVTLSQADSEFGRQSVCQLGPYPASASCDPSLMRSRARKTTRLNSSAHRRGRSRAPSGRLGKPRRRPFACRWSPAKHGPLECMQQLNLLDDYWAFPPERANELAMASWPRRCSERQDSTRLVHGLPLDECSTNCQPDGWLAGRLTVSRRLRCAYGTSTATAAPPSPRHETHQ